ncbi:hypothetical protein CLOSTASPAR_00211 [[Clostridium] asparagiforme DSM 15981]|uniref:Uncharacterized protein n=1 Tax=[Clostridium] asparagiforme DSM 15981 TaxID=518636 RepID=C0CTB3_9FIRM|nr:hypothetical protein CLOSTASPAR_00211 [[Clostridium] asparagiforme DSM 15981]
MGLHFDVDSPRILSQRFHPVVPVADKNVDKVGGIPPAFKASEVFLSGPGFRIAEYIGNAGLPQTPQNPRYRRNDKVVLRILPVVFQNRLQVGELPSKDKIQFQTGLKGLNRPPGGQKLVKVRILERHTAKIHCVFDFLAKGSFADS